MKKSLYELLQLQSIVLSGDVTEEMTISLIQWYGKLVNEEECAIFMYSNGGCYAAARNIEGILKDIKKHTKLHIIAVGDIISGGIYIFNQGTYRYCLPEVQYTIHRSYFPSLKNVSIENIDALAKNLKNDKLWEGAKKTLKLSKADIDLVESGKDLVLDAQQAKKAKLVDRILK